MIEIVFFIIRNIWRKTMSSWSNKVMKDLGGFFQKGQREAIYAACKSQRDRVLIRVFWKSGRRCGEVLMLKVKDIDFENNDIIWHILKKSKKVLDENKEPQFYIDEFGKQRYETKKIDLRVRKPIDKVTAQLLKDYIESESLGPESYVFESPYKIDSPITRQRVFQIVRELCEKAGIYFVGDKKPHPHHFRHSFAIDLAKKAKTASGVMVIKNALEHSSVSQTEHYLQFGSEELRELIED